MSTPAQRGSHPALSLLGAAVSAWGLIACSRQPDLDEIFPPPRPIGQTDVQHSRVERYDFAPGSVVEFRVGSARSGRARGSVELVSGSLQLDCFDPRLSSGHAVFDLATVSVEDDAPAGGENSARWKSLGSGSATERARRWLELGAAALGEGHPDFRYARFTLTSIGAAPGQTVFDGERLRGGAGSALRRRLRLQASGDLELHGVRFPYTAPVEAVFEWPDASVPGQSPRRIELTTREPISMDLTTHGILPRRETGEVDAEGLAELRKGLGHHLRVSARWVAVAPSAPGAAPSER